MRCILMILLLSFSILRAITCMSQSSNYDRYIDQYWSMAIEQMQKYNIPASITLAQGLIETRAGQSKLAVIANNHFGIKCSHGWTGPYILADDDRPNERFRSYGNARESYEDHSKFLMQNQRYRFLFNLDPKDYKGWAYGLKSAGYATNPAYADMLISVIENYRLYRYDSNKGINPRRIQRIDRKNDHIVYFNNDNYYIICRDGDTFKSIEKETGVSRRKLLKYNELPSDHIIRDGDILYMEKKKKRADLQYRGKLIKVSDGESYYSISQKYGIRLKYLYKMNCLPEDAQIYAGQELFVNR